MTLSKFIHFLLFTSFGFSMLFVSACGLKQQHQRVQKEIIENHRTQQLKLDRTIAFNDTNKVILDSIDWNETMHVFPSGVPSGPPATFRFVFRNLSDKAVTIDGVNAACSCTATEFTRTPVAPGDTGWVEAAYKTENTFGYFRKYVDVYFEGSPNKHRLYLRGSVDPMMPVPKK